VGAASIAKARFNRSAEGVAYVTATADVQLGLDD
jgi:hypothetical protein